MPKIDDFGIYIHWPYCVRLCPYCDFNIYKAGRSAADPLVNAIVQDMEHQKHRMEPRRLTSIHFGGGTPSLLNEGALSKIIDTARALWPAVNDLEIGLEANPNDCHASTLRGWKRAGVNRLSVGVQSFGDEVLGFLGRDHDGTCAAHAIEQAQKVYDQISIDLIFGLKTQTLKAWQNDLATALAHDVNHISTYQLTIKPDTAFARAEQRGQTKAVNEDFSAEFYTCAVNTLAAKGFVHYEVSNFAKTPRDKSKHNLLYWTGGEYLGLGPGAHGRIKVNGRRCETINHLKPADYIHSIKKSSCGISEIHPLTNREIAAEYILMGLRAKSGISMVHYQSLSADPLDANVLNWCQENGYLEISSDRIKPTEKGFLLLDTITHKLLGA